MNYDTDDQIILLDAGGRPIGAADKLASHHADTPLHMAFSCYIFNSQGQFLVTQRAFTKKVWPGVWTNSCCGHPRPNEPIEAAIARRCQDELGILVHDLQVMLPDYRYKTPPYNGIIEHEVCPVYIARSDDTLQLNPDEVAAAEWVDWSAYMQAAQADQTDEYSWWCKDQLRQLTDNPLILKITC